jgi:FHA domain
MSLEADELPQPFAIEHFADDSHRLDATAFKGRHGDAFLVRRGSLDPGRRPERPQRTVVMEEVLTLPDAPLKGPRPSKNLLVIPVVATGRSPYPSMVTVGRTRNNDVVLPDVVVSKFHAFFRVEGGKFFVQDADSRNGTWVDGKPVPAKNAGKPVLVPSGARMKFGLLDFWFLSAAGLQDLVRRSCPIL